MVINLRKSIDNWSKKLPLAERTAQNIDSDKCITNEATQVALDNCDNTSSNRILRPCANGNNSTNNNANLTSKNNDSLRVIKLKGVLHLWALFLKIWCIFFKKIKQPWTSYPMDLVRIVPRNSKTTVLLQYRPLL